MVERQLCKLDVRSSNLLASTTAAQRHGNMGDGQRGEESRAGTTKAGRKQTLRPHASRLKPREPAQADP